MSKDATSILEHRAKMRKRREFVSEFKGAVKPIFARYCGITNSGTWAEKVAESALNSVKASVDDAAIAELEMTIERFLVIAMEGTESMQGVIRSAESIRKTICDIMDDDYLLDLLPDGPRRQIKGLFNDLLEAKSRL